MKQIISSTRAKKSKAALVGLRRASSAAFEYEVGAGEMAGELTRQYYEGRQVVRHAPGEDLQEFPSSDGPEVIHEASFGLENCFH